MALMERSYKKSKLTDAGWEGRHVPILICHAFDSRLALSVTRVDLERARVSTIINNESFLSKSCRVIQGSLARAVKVIEILLRVEASGRVQANVVGPVGEMGHIERQIVHVRVVQVREGRSDVFRVVTQVAPRVILPL